MKRCADCIHSRVCEFHEIIADIKVHPRGELCGYFCEGADMPCELGDTVYTVSGDRVIPITVQTLGRRADGSWNINHIEDDKLGRMPTGVKGAVFGKNTFLAMGDALNASRKGRSNDGGETYGEEKVRDTRQGAGAKQSDSG